MSKQSKKPGQTYYSVFYAFWAELSIVVGLFALFIAFSFSSINWNAGPPAITTQLVIASIIGGTVGGLMTRSTRKGMLPGIVLAIVVFVVLVIVVIILFIVDFVESLSSCSSAPPIPNAPPSWNLSDPGWFWAIILPYYLAWFTPVYIILACTIPSGVIGGVFSRRVIKVPPRRQEQLTVREQFGKLSEAFKKPLFVIIFVIVWIPLIIPLFSGNNDVQKEYSAWNSGSSGTSQFREQIQAAGYTNTMSSLTSYSPLSRINESFVLVILGPNRFFNPVSDIPFLETFIKNNGSVLIAHEEGSTEWFFTYSTLASAGTSRMFPLTFFMEGILRDNQSHYLQNDFPVITAGNINPHPIMTGVNSLLLNHASALMLLPGMAGIFGWNVLATSTSQYSWVDKAQAGHSDGDGMYEPTIDNFNPKGLNLPSLLFCFLKSNGISFPDGIPQGGYPLPVVAATELGTNGPRIIVTSDASMFSNQLIGLPGYDNDRFALNCIDWLTRGNHSMKVVFDEYHLRPEAGQDASAPALYGQVLDYISFLSSNWIIAPFYPFLALSTLRRWLPKSEEQNRKNQEKKQRREVWKAKQANRKAKQERQVLGRLLFEKPVENKPSKADQPATKAKTFEQKRTEKRIANMGIVKKSTFFAQKLQWYMEKSEFNYALELLYNRIKRLASKKIGEGASRDTIINAIVEKFPQVERKKIDYFFKRMEKIIQKGAGKQKITSVESFENLYYEIITIGEYLEKM